MIKKIYPVVKLIAYVLILSFLPGSTAPVSVASEPFKFSADSTDQISKLTLLSTESSVETFSESSAVVQLDYYCLNFTSATDQNNSVVHLIRFQAAKIMPLIISVPSKISVKELLTRYNGVAAINGSFFTAEKSTRILGSYKPDHGEIMPHIHYNWPALMISDQRELSIIPRNKRGLLHQSSSYLSSRPLLLFNGEIASEIKDLGYRYELNPRSALGLSADSKFVNLIIVEGRTTTSAGVSICELAEICQLLGLSSAINLDGGASTALAIKSSTIDLPIFFQGWPIKFPSRNIPVGIVFQPREEKYSHQN